MQVDGWAEIPLLFKQNCVRVHTWRQGRVCGDHQAGCLPSLDLHRRHGGSFEAGRSGDADADGPKKKKNRLCLNKQNFV